MRKNGKDRLIFILVMLISCVGVSAQWRQVQFPRNHMVSHVIATDDGRGMVFLTDNRMRVAVTRDDWRTFDTVLLPEPEAPYVFEPYSYDTTANGTVVVVGQHRPPLVELGWAGKRQQHCNTATAAYYSTDWGTSWTEMLPRQPGRYMSITFRGRQEGLLLYEHDWKDSVKRADSWYYRTEFGRDILVVDELMQIKSRIVIDTLTSIRKSRGNPYSNYCVEGVSKIPGFLDRINDSVWVIQTNHPCQNTHSFQDPPDPFSQSPYSVAVSTNGGQTWDESFRTAGQYEFYYSRYKSMRLVNDTTWIDNQGFIYEGTRIQPRLLDCPNLPWKGFVWRFWITSATNQNGNLLWVTGDSSSTLPDSGGFKRYAIRIIFFNPMTCEIESSDSFEWRYLIVKGDTLIGSLDLMPQLLRNGGAVESRAFVSRLIGTKDQLTYHWSIFVRDAKTSSTSDETESTASLLQERNGEIFLPAPLHEQSQAEYYSLIGSLQALVPIRAGASQTTVPKLPVGVYIVRIANEPPLKILVR